MRIPRCLYGAIHTAIDYPKWFKVEFNRIVLRKLSSFTLFVLFLEISREFWSDKILALWKLHSRHEISPVFSSVTFCEKVNPSGIRVVLREVNQPGLQKVPGRHGGYFCRVCCKLLIARRKCSVEKGNFEYYFAIVLQICEFLVTIAEVAIVSVICWSCSIWQIGPIRIEQS